MKSSEWPPSAKARSVAAANSRRASAAGGAPVANGREQGAFGGLAMAHGAPVPEPALERREIGPARKRGALPSRRLAIAVRRDPPGAVEEREISLLFRQHGEEVAERGEDGRADSPAVAVLDGEQRRLPQDLPRGHASRELSPHGLGDHEAEVVGQAVVEPTAPVAQGVAMAERRLDPDLSITHLDRTGRDIVGPEIEGAAAREIEARVMPMASEDAVLDAAAIERKAHMRAAVVEREDASPVVDDQDRGMAAMQHEPTLGLQLGEAACAHKVGGRHIHRCRSQCAVKPPSTGRPTPITKLAAGLHSHSTAAATSSARPRRPIDCCFMISAIASA